MNTAALWRLVRKTRPGAVSAYARVLLAAQAGRGVRLSADEVAALTIDQAVRDAVARALEELADADGVQPDWRPDGTDRVVW